MAMGGGIVTLLFTDIVGSTELLSVLGDDAYEEVRRKHFRVLGDVVNAAGGSEVKKLGDGLMAVFPSSVDAVRCAMAIQRAVARQNLTGGAGRVEVRVGLHVGEQLPYRWHSRPGIHTARPKGFWTEGFYASRMRKIRDIPGGNLP
jgi:class 3 adenylate cyclase